MTVHQCPKCELRFDHKTEVEDHCWHDHPEFRHDYPATVPPPSETVVEAPHPAAAPEHHRLTESIAGWLTPGVKRAQGHTHERDA